MVQEAEKYRDEDEVNEPKNEAEIGLENFRVTVCNTLRNPRERSTAVTDTDLNLVRILITDDSHAKLNVVGRMEPWSSIALTGDSDWFRNL